MILLDTNAVLFILTGNRRARPLEPHFGRLRFSPFVLLELKILEEGGRTRFTTVPAEAAVRDRRWIVDTPPLDSVIAAALDLSWTRDPFDRMITAHALSRRYRLATSDATILHNLSPRMRLAL